MVLPSHRAHSMCMTGHIPHDRDVPFPRDVGSLLDVSFLWGVFYSRDVPFLLDVSFLWGVFYSRDVPLGKGTSLE
jgi:hypothetical protein